MREQTNTLNVDIDIKRHKWEDSRRMRKKTSRQTDRPTERNMPRQGKEIDRAE